MFIGTGDGGEELLHGGGRDGGVMAALEEEDREMELGPEGAAVLNHLAHLIEGGGGDTGATRQPFLNSGVIEIDGGVKVEDTLFDERAEAFKVVGIEPRHNVAKGDDIAQTFIGHSVEGGEHNEAIDVTESGDEVGGEDGTHRVADDKQMLIFIF